MTTRDKSDKCAKAAPKEEMAKAAAPQVTEEAQLLQAFTSSVDGYRRLSATQRYSVVMGRMDLALGNLIKAKMGEENLSESTAREKAMTAIKTVCAYINIEGVDNPRRTLDEVKKTIQAVTGLHMTKGSQDLSAPVVALISELRAKRGQPEAAVRTLDERGFPLRYQV